SPARYSGLDPAAEHVTRNLVAMEIVEPQRMRPRPHDRHVAHQHVDELGQLIETRAPEKRPERRHARIVLSRLRNFTNLRLVVHRHRTEFPNDYLAVVEAAPPLSKQD